MKTLRSYRNTVVISQVGKEGLPPLFVAQVESLKKKRVPQNVAAGWELLSSTQVMKEERGQGGVPSGAAPPGTPPLPRSYPLLT